MSERTESTMMMDQLRRAEAIDRARTALASRSGGFTPGSSAPDAMDLIHVAMWIYDGRDPWSDDSEPSEESLAASLSEQMALFDVPRTVAVEGSGHPGGARFLDTSLRTEPLHPHAAVVGGVPGNYLA